MPYLYATQDQDFSDYSSGRVLYSQSGMPAFPVRLTSDIFQRAARYLPTTARLTLYDPTCGGGYHLTALGLLHGDRIARILASDVDENAVLLARRNLGLLNPSGLAQRERELQNLLQTYGKPAHLEALVSLARLRSRLLTHQEITTTVFQANALEAQTFSGALSQENIHLVLCDIPYGQMSAWQRSRTSSEQDDPVWQMLEALRSGLTTTPVVAIAADKRQKLVHSAYQRLERFQIGKRQISLMRLRPAG